MSMQPGTQHSETVRTEHHGDIAVIVVDNPPVNAIAPSVRDGIYAAVQELGADPAVRGRSVVSGPRCGI